MKQHIIEKIWETKAGLRAVCMMNERSRSRCGYVEVKKEHPCYGVDYDNIERGDDVEDTYIAVHGGLTFSSREKDPDYPLPSKGWWFGFDCAHMGDKTKYRDEGIHRSRGFVVGECERLAEQLIEARVREKENEMKIIKIKQDEVERGIHIGMDDTFDLIVNSDRLHLVVMNAIGEKTEIRFSADGCLESLMTEHAV